MSQASKRADQSDASFGQAGAINVPVRVARFLLGPAAVMATAAIVASFDGASSNAGAFVLGTCLTLIVSAALVCMSRTVSWQGNARVAVLLLWLLSSILAAVPFLILGAQDKVGAVGVYANAISAWFESVSGLTSCGLTMTDQAHQLSPALQWYRSMLEWIGGLGLIALVASLTDSDERGMLRTQQWELRSEDRKAGMRRVVILYVSLTFASILAFRIAGMPWWESVNHGLTGISTGGFVITSNSFQEYAPAIKAVALPVMLAGAMSLVIAARMVHGERMRTFRESRVPLIYFGVVAAGTLVAITIAKPEGWNRLDAAFQWVSAITTSGFSARSDMSSYPGNTILFLMIVGMLIGGMSRSTAGGIKIDRVALLARSQSARNFTVKWFVLAAASWIALVLLSDASAWAAAIEAVSALGTVGLSSGLASADAHSGTKLLLIFLMLIGRLEGVRFLRMKTSATR